MKILTVNAGGSTVRLGSHPVRQPAEWSQEKHGAVVKPEDMRSLLVSFLGERGVEGVAAVCHRVVHAGYRQSICKLIDDEVETAIRDHTCLAPIHNPSAIRWIEACRALFGAEVPQVAAFDSGFYADLPDVAASYAVPPSLGMRRLGFHGLAHMSMLDQARDTIGGSIDQMKILSLQLGSGCSISAIKSGKPVDTSMGFTPLEGLMMNTRSGDIDPGILLHLVNENEMTPLDVDFLLSHNAGLLGVSGRSDDIAELIALDDDQAQLAVDMFCYRLRKYIGAYVAVLGGLNMVLIGGGIGENLPAVRARFLSDLEVFGMRIDERRNNATVGNGGVISSADSSVEIRVVEVEENRLMANETIGLLSLSEPAAF